jgi:hypothetical protein
MKKYWVLAWLDYYPSGGLKNVHSTYSTRKEAEKAVQQLKNEPVPYDNIELVDVTDMLEGRTYSKDEYCEMLLTLLDRMPSDYKTTLMKAQEEELVRLLNERS